MVRCCWLLCISLYLCGNQEAAQPGLIIRTISPDVSRHELPSCQLPATSCSPWVEFPASCSCCAPGAAAALSAAAAEMLTRTLLPPSSVIWMLDKPGHGNTYSCYLTQISPPSPVSTLLRPSSGSAAAAGGNRELKMFKVKLHRSAPD